MEPRTRAHDWPGRITVGAFMLNSGLSKRDVPEETASQLHGFASGTYPFLARLTPRDFTRALSWGETTLGAALLLPLVPTGVAGAGLAAFSGGLIGLYLRTPGMRRPGSLRPTEQGTALAKDAWLLGMGIGFVLDEFLGRRRSDR